MRPLIFLTGSYPHQRTIQLFGRVVCLIVATALLFSSAVRGEDVPPNDQTAMSFYTSLPDEPDAEQVEKLFGLMKAECSIADPDMKRSFDRAFRVVTIASMPPDVFRSACEAREERSPEKPNEFGNRYPPVMKGFRLLHSYARCVVASVPKEGEARSRCLFAATSLAEFLHEQAAHSRSLRDGRPDRAPDVLASALKLIEDSGALEQFDEALLKGVADVQLAGVTLKDKMAQWRAAVEASPNDAFRLLGLELKLLEIATPENVLSKQLPEVFQLDAKTYLRTIVRDYISRDFLPEPRWVDQDMVFYDKSLSDELAFRVAGKYLVSPIMAGKDATYRRLSYVFGICQIYGSKLGTTMSRRLAKDLWEPLARFKVAAARKSWSSNAPTRKLKKVREGTIEDVTFLGDYSLSGKGRAKVEVDHIFPIVLFWEGREKKSFQHRDFFHNVRAQEDALGSTPYLLYDRRLHNVLQQFSWAVPPLPIGIEVDFDYTDEGLAKMGTDPALMKRVTNGFCRTPERGFSPAELREKFSPAVFYQYHKCKYEIFTVMECSEYPGVEMELALAAAVIYPCDGEKPVSASPLLLCQGAGTWFKKISLISEPYSWHLAELRERPEIKVIRKEAEPVTDDIEMRFDDIREEYTNKTKAAHFAEFGEQADPGPNPNDAAAGGNKQ
ncbi:MAG: hypothetical protein WC712_09240 [Candidatus Brocadiia bacterium]